MAARDLGKLGCALLVGVALAFPAGLMVARRGADPPEGPRARPEGGEAVRDVYSPAMLGDPWFLERQREGVEALERHCQQTGETCAEAREARRWLDRQGG